MPWCRRSDSFREVEKSLVMPLGGMMGGRASSEMARPAGDAPADARVAEGIVLDGVDRERGRVRAELGEGLVAHLEEVALERVVADDVELPGEDQAGTRHAGGGEGREHRVEGGPPGLEP